METNSPKWIDITEDFLDAVSSWFLTVFPVHSVSLSIIKFFPTHFIVVLKLGELFHDELFGLFEAMSAIEMMDPKMDAGMLCNRGGKPPMNFDQALSVVICKFNFICPESRKQLELFSGRTNQS